MTVSQSRLRNRGFAIVMTTRSQTGCELIQAVTPSQIAAARELFNEYAGSLGFSLCFQSFEQELAQLPGKYAPPSGRLLLAECDRQWAGCIAVHALEDGICEMKRLYVRPQFRGRYLGRRLVNAILDEARAAGYTRMRLDTIPKIMGHAVALYREVGFREIAPYTLNPIEGAIYLELEL
jgi:putative acetyltransferase